MNKDELLHEIVEEHWHRLPDDIHKIALIGVALDACPICRWNNTTSVEQITKYVRVTPSQTTNILNSLIQLGHLQGEIDGQTIKVQIQDPRWK